MHKTSENKVFWHVAQIARAFPSFLPCRPSRRYNIQPTYCGRSVFAGFFFFFSSTSPDGSSFECNGELGAILLRSCILVEYTYSGSACSRNLNVDGSGASAVSLFLEATAGHHCTLYNVPNRKKRFRAR